MTESVFNTAYGIWNSLVSLAMTLFTTSPTAANSSVYSTCRLMYNAITDISLPIAIVFFLIAICKDVVSSPPDQQVRKFFGDALKFCILIGILANLWDVMGYIMQIADGVTDKLSSNGSATYLMSMSGDLSSVIADVEDLAPQTEIHFTSFGTDLIAFAKEYLEIAMSIIGKVIVSFLIIAIGFKLIKILIKLLKTTLEKAEIDYGVISFSCSFIRIGLRCIVIFMAVAHMGVEVSSFIALLGSAGVAVGLALQGTLSNVAGGVLLLILKPFQVGDYIVLTGTDCEGEVAAMDIFYTKLKTIDNRVIVIPNGTLSNSNLINNTKQERRLIDIEVGISYDADIKEVKRILTDIAKNEKRILDQDGVNIFVSSLADSSVMMGIRCWVPTSDYVATKWALNEEIKIRFDEEGIEIPYQKLDVCIKNEV